MQALFLERIINPRCALVFGRVVPFTFD